MQAHLDQVHALGGPARQGVDVHRHDLPALVRPPVHLVIVLPDPAPANGIARFGGIRLPCHAQLLAPYPCGEAPACQHNCDTPHDIEAGVRVEW